MSAQGSYGNSGINLKESIDVSKIIAQIVPKKAKEILAVKFQGQILAIDSLIETNGEIDFITVADDWGRKLLLNSVAVYWDMAYRQIVGKTVHYEQHIRENEAILSYFLTQRFTADSLAKITNRANELQKQAFSLERILISAHDTLKYYEKSGEWYLAKQIALEDSDYPYKFLRINDYLYRDNGLFVSLFNSLAQIAVDEISYQLVDDKLVGIVNLKVIF